MDYDKLSQDSKAYIDRYIRCSGKTREQAMQEELVRLVVREYEDGVNHSSR